MYMKTINVNINLLKTNFQKKNIIYNKYNFIYNYVKNNSYQNKVFSNEN